MNQLPRPMRESSQELSHADLVELVLMLFERIDQLAARVNELEAQVSKNSKNSHKPPSSDGLKRADAGKAVLNPNAEKWNWCATLMRGKIVLRSIRKCSRAAMRVAAGCQRIVS